MIPCNLLLTPSLPTQWDLLVSSNPNPTSTASPTVLPYPVNARRLLCLCRRRDSSLDPNAESFRGGRFRFRDESSSGELGGDFVQGSQRRWWSDGNPDDDFKEEFDSIDDDDDDGEQLWDKIWIFKVFKSYGYLLPAIIASILLATGPKAFLMALALPLGQSAISLAIGKLWGGGQEEQRTSSTTRKPFSTTSAGFRKQDESSVENKRQAGFRKQDESSVENKRQAAHQSWVSTENGSNDNRGKDSERPSFGGWDELDQDEETGEAAAAAWS